LHTGVDREHFRRAVHRGIAPKRSRLGCMGHGRAAITLNAGAVGCCRQCEGAAEQGVAADRPSRAVKAVVASEASRVQPLLASVAGRTAERQTFGGSILPGWIRVVRVAKARAHRPSGSVVGDALHRV
jgi:hypothetical protein